MGRLITNSRMTGHFGLLDPEDIYRELHAKRVKSKAELDFNAHTCRQHTLEEEGRLLMKADMGGNW
jgi:hypothetical protein